MVINNKSVSGFSQCTHITLDRQSACYSVDICMYMYVCVERKSSHSRAPNSRRKTRANRGTGGAFLLYVCQCRVCVCTHFIQLNAEVGIYRASACIYGMGSNQHFIVCNGHLERNSERSPTLGESQMKFKLFSHIVFLYRRFYPIMILFTESQRNLLNM